MSKAPQAFRTISEVSETLDVPQHVLRFWESKFPQIRLLKRAGGRRYYRPEDIDLLRGIRTLLYAEGYTIKGVQKVLKDSGPRYVCDVGRYGLKRSTRTGEWDTAPAFLAGPLSLTDDGEIKTGQRQGALDASGEADLDNRAREAADPADPADETTLDELDSTDGAGLTERRSALEAALQELLTLREMVQAVRPKKSDAA